MRLKVTESITDWEGEPVVIDGKPLTFRQVFAIAVNTVEPDEKLTIEQKTKLYSIGSKVFAKNEVDLTTGEANTLLERVNKFWTPLVFGRVKDVLDPAPEPSKD